MVQNEGINSKSPEEMMRNLPLVLQLLVLLAGVVSADEGLHPGDDLGQFVITHLLKLTQHSGLEEDLCVFCVCVCVCARAGGICVERVETEN